MLCTWVQCIVSMISCLESSTYIVMLRDAVFMRDARPGAREGEEGVLGEHGEVEAGGRRISSWSVRNAVRDV